MEKVTKILFPTDFSECAENAFAYALKLAAKMQAQVEVLHVVYPVAEALDYPVLVGQATQDQLDIKVDVLRNFVKRGVAKAEEKAAAKLYTLQDIEVGTPVDAIVANAQRNAIDLIIMGTRGQRKGLDRWLGSVAAGVVAQASCPVMVVPEQLPNRAPKTLVYASDLHKADPFELWKATRWLAPFEVQVHCVHINDGPASGIMQMEELKTFFAKQFHQMDIAFHHLPGKALVSTINDFTEKINADLVIMFQPQRPFFERIFHKSQTVNMVDHLRLPLLVMK